MPDSFAPPRPVPARTHLAAWIALLAVGVVGCGVGQVPGMTEAESPTVVVVREFLEAYNAHDVDAMARLMADSIAWFSVDGGTLTTEVIGREELREEMVAHFARRPEARSRFLTINGLGRFVTTHELAVAERDGADVSQASVAVYEVVGGRIVNVWYYPPERHPGPE